MHVRSRCTINGISCSQRITGCWALLRSGGRRSTPCGGGPSSSTTVPMLSTPYSGPISIVDYSQHSPLSCSARLLFYQHLLPTWSSPSLAYPVSSGHLLWTGLLRKTFLLHHSNEYFSLNEVKFEANSDTTISCCSLGN